jgi:hypothetical protein
MITWLDLYNFLFERANNINAVGTFQWNTPIVIYDAATGDKFFCDTYYLEDTDDGLVLMINKEDR